MDALNASMLALWLAWAVSLFAYRATVRRLADLLSTSAPTRAALIQFPEGASNFLEPFRWYLRVRRVVQQEAQSPSESGELKVTAKRATRLLLLVEIGAAVLLLMIAAISAHNLSVHFW